MELSIIVKTLLHTSNKNQMANQKANKTYILNIFDRYERSEGVVRQFTQNPFNNTTKLINSCWQSKDLKTGIQIVQRNRIWILSTTLMGIIHYQFSRSHTIDMWILFNIRCQGLSHDSPMIYVSVLWERLYWWTWGIMWMHTWKWCTQDPVTRRVKLYQQIWFFRLLKENLLQGEINSSNNTGT